MLVECVLIDYDITQVNPQQLLQVRLRNTSILYILLLVMTSDYDMVAMTTGDGASVKDEKKAGLSLFCWYVTHLSLCQPLGPPVITSVCLTSCPSSPLSSCLSCPAFVHISAGGSITPSPSTILFHTKRYSPVTIRYCRRPVCQSVCHSLSESV